MKPSPRSSFLATIAAALPLLLPWCAAACGTVEMPEGEGAGLVSVDAQPASAVTTYGRPVLRQGQGFVFRKGGVVPLELRVQAAGEDGYELREMQSSIVTLLDRDLGECGERTQDGEATLAIAPADPLFTWPLWVGKRWTAEFLLKRPGVPPLPVQAQYHCDAAETIEVPAGRFQCLRVWKRMSVLGTAKYIGRASITWYAPDVGFFVQRLDSGTLLELERVVLPPPGSGDAAAAGR